MASVVSVCPCHMRSHVCTQATERLFRRRRSPSGCLSAPLASDSHEAHADGPQEACGARLAAGG